MNVNRWLVLAQKVTPYPEKVTDISWIFRPSGHQASDFGHNLNAKNVNMTCHKV